MSGMIPYRPGPTGLEPNPVEQRTWRNRLRSRRWNPAPLDNPVGEESTPTAAMAFWLGLAVLTFIVLVVGYGTGFWGPIA